MPKGPPRRRYQAILPGNLEWDEAICTAFTAREGPPVEFYPEALDLLRFPDESYVQGRLNILRLRYGSRSTALSIPIGDLVRSFLQALGKGLFPGSPIVFRAVAKQQVEAPPLPPHITGMVAWVDVQGTLEAALKLQPGARHVAWWGAQAKPAGLFSTWPGWAEGAPSANLPAPRPMKSSSPSWPL